MFAAFGADERLWKACPAAFLAPGEIYPSTVRLIVQDGGPALLDHILPASHLIERVWLKKWPQCPAVREALGYAKVQP